MKDKDFDIEEPFKGLFTQGMVCHETYKDIENNWIVISEAIQTILRREGFEDPYEIMKHLTRKNSKLDKESIHRFIDNLDVNNNIKLELKKITPYNYTGIDYEKN